MIIKWAKLLKQIHDNESYGAFIEAEKEMFSLIIQPIPLQKFIEADKDKGCIECWLSSSGAKHPECKVKIANWFACRKALIFLGESNEEGSKSNTTRVEGSF